MLPNQYAALHATLRTVAIVAGLTVGWPFSAIAADKPAVAKSMRVYFGTYTGQAGEGPQGAVAASEGIYVASFNPETGELSAPVLAVKVPSPSFVAVNKSGTRLYAAVEDWTAKGGKAIAYAIDPATGKLRLLGDVATGGTGPCHLSLSPDEKRLAVANYGGGSAMGVALNDRGDFASKPVVFQHAGKSVNPQRQEGPHAHCIRFDGTGGFALCPDLGIDQVLIYKNGQGAKDFTQNDPKSANLPPGAGPRHLAFHPTNKFVFVLNELSSMLATFEFDATNGTMTSRSSVSTLPAGFTGNNTTAEVVVHPSGKFVYASNRGHDSLAIFTIDQSTGELTAIGHELVGGKTPRNFNIDPAGKFMIVANQDSNNINVFQIDGETGLLKSTGQGVSLAKPVCVVFVK